MCAEIGTWRGDFAAAILRSRRPAQLHLIDAWEHRTEAEYEQASYGGHSRGRAEEDGCDIRERHRSLPVLRSNAGRSSFRRARSVDAAAFFPDESLDWVYIDADHAYEGVKRDLDAYFRVVKPGGFIAGDDYGREGQMVSGTE